jgi:hypothetical protein
MRRAVESIVLALAAIILIGCARNASDIEGNWVIDLEPMLQQARELGGASRDIHKIRETFIDGMMVIDSKHIIFGIRGMQDRTTWDYNISSKEGKCVLLTTNVDTRTLKYCVDGNRLEIHDPGTKLVVIYKRA